MIRGSIVLVPFPFTNLSQKKLRPAIVISKESFGHDVIVAFISSRIGRSKGPTDFVLSSVDREFTQTGLKVSSIFRMNKLVTLDQDLIVGELGGVGRNTQKALDQCLRYALAL